MMQQLGGAQPAVEQSMALEDQFAYYMAILFERDPKAARDVIKEIDERLADDFIAGLKSLEKSSGFKRAEPYDRLLWYRIKPAELWTEQQAKFPRDWAEDCDDYADLRDRALDGDFGIAEQMKESIAYASAELMR